jgi:hypothetical protein
MYMCVRGIDFAFVSTIFLLEFETVLTVCSIFSFSFYYRYFEPNIGLITLLSTKHRTDHSIVNQTLEWSLYCQPNIGLVTILSTKHRTDNSIVNQT